MDIFFDAVEKYDPELQKHLPPFDLLSRVQTLHAKALQLFGSDYNNGDPTSLAPFVSGELRGEEWHSYVGAETWVSFGGKPAIEQFFSELSSLDAAFQEVVNPYVGHGLEKEGNSIWWVYDPAKFTFPAAAVVFGELEQLFQDFDNCLVGGKYFECEGEGCPGSWWKGWYKDNIVERATIEYPSIAQKREQN